MKKYFLNKICFLKSLLNPIYNKELQKLCLKFVFVFKNKNEFHFPFFTFKSEHFPKTSIYIKIKSNLTFNFDHEESDYLGTKVPSIFKNPRLSKPEIRSIILNYNLEIF